MSYCKKCEAIEPHDWNMITKGLWSCDCKTKTIPITNRKKAFDAAVKQVCGIMECDEN